MGMIRVKAKKDVWYGTDPANHKLYTAKAADSIEKGGFNETFSVREEDFSDYHKIRVVGGMTLRGAMVKVTEKIVDGKVITTEVDAPDVTVNIQKPAAKEKKGAAVDAV